MTAYQATQYDLSSVDGPADGWILDSVMQELNITTSERTLTLFILLDITYMSKFD